MSNRAKEENKAEMISRLSENAYRVVNMIKAVCCTSEGLNIYDALFYAAGLAGYSCLKAAKVFDENLSVITKYNNKFYRDDRIKNYLFDKETGAISFCLDVTELSEDVAANIYLNVLNSIGTKKFSVSNMHVAKAVSLINPCWTGIYFNMTTKFCKNHKEWPVFYGIVLKLMIEEGLNEGINREELGRYAVECASSMSMIDPDVVCIDYSTSNVKVNKQHFVTDDDKKFIPKVCGKTKIMEDTILFLILVLMAVLFFADFYLLFELGVRTGSTLIAFLFINIFYLILLQWFFRIVVNSKRYRKSLKNKFDNLSEENQLEVLSAVKNYKSLDRIGYSDNFIYGKLIRSKNANSIPNKFLVFEYISYKDIVWVYSSNDRMSLNDGIGTVIKTVTLYMFTKDGYCYRRDIDTNTCNAIKDRIKNTNPYCMVGYSSDNRNKYNTYYKK